MDFLYNVSISVVHICYSMKLPKPLVSELCLRQLRSFGVALTIHIGI